MYICIYVYIYIHCMFLISLTPLLYIYMTRIDYADISMTKTDTMTLGECLARREDIDNDPQDPEVGMSG